MYLFLVISVFVVFIFGWCRTRKQVIQMGYEKSLTVSGGPRWTAKVSAVTIGDELYAFRGNTLFVYKMNDSKTQARFIRKG